MVLAQEESRLLDQDVIGSEHLLLGVLREDEGLGARALESLGIGLEEVRRNVEERAGSARSSGTGSPPFGSDAKRALELALREALCCR